MTGARPGTVNFELDIQKEHTVCSSLLTTMLSLLTGCEESSGNTSWWHNSKYGYVDGVICSVISKILINLVDLGGSLAVASKGLFATGVSTDLNGMQ